MLLTLFSPSSAKPLVTNQCRYGTKQPLTWNKKATQVSLGQRIAALPPACLIKLLLKRVYLIAIGHLQYKVNLKMPFMTAWLLGAHCVPPTEVLLTFEPCFIWTYPIFRLQHKTFASASSRGLSAPTHKMPDAGHGWGKHTELGTAPGSSSEAVLILHVLHGSFSSLVSWPKVSSYYHWVLFQKFYFFQVKKGDLGAGMHGISWREKYLLRECRWLQNLFPPSPLFHQKEHSPWLYTQTSILKIAKFHLDCGGVKDRRQMHWLPARLDIHFFFPHPGSQQLHTRAQVRSLVAKPTVSASPSIH